MTPSRVLIREKNFERYIDHYVAQASFEGGNVIAFDKDLIRTYEKAIKKGYEHPVIFYVLNPLISQIYIATS